MTAPKTNSIKELWDSFNKEVLPEDAPEVQRVEMRRAFWAGAMGMMEINLRVSNLHEDEGVAILSAVTDEMGEFFAELKAGRA